MTNGDQDLIINKRRCNSLGSIVTVLKCGQLHIWGWEWLPILDAFPAFQKDLTSPVGITYIIGRGGDHQEGLSWQAVSFKVSYVGWRLVHFLANAIECLVLLAEKYRISQIENQCITDDWLEVWLKVADVAPVL